LILRLARRREPSGESPSLKSVVSHTPHTHSPFPTARNANDLWRRNRSVSRNHETLRLPSVRKCSIFGHSDDHFPVALWVAAWQSGLRKRASAASGQAWERRKRCRKHHGNLSLESCGYPIPSGRAWPATGSESCVDREQSRLRSVDSERRGPAIEPRKKLVFVGALAVR